MSTTTAHQSVTIDRLTALQGARIARYADEAAADMTVTWHTCDTIGRYARATGRIESWDAVAVEAALDLVAYDPNTPEYRAALSITGYADKAHQAIAKAARS